MLIVTVVVLISSVQRAVEWQLVPIEEIIEDYDDGIFDSPDPTTRTEITPEGLEDYPFQDNAGEPILIYDLDGYHIQRRRGVTQNDDQPLGVLLKSDKLKKLFEFDVDDSPDGDTGSYPGSPTTFHFYPQAGLRTAGHVQANGLITKCYPLVHTIDRDIQDPLDEPDARGPNDNDNHEGIGNGNPTFVYSRQSVFGISSQGYNTVMHRTRGRKAQHHDAQVGLVTAALGGAWAVNNTSQSKTGRRIEAGCARKMPHKAFADKIRNQPLSRDLRMENVYYIDVNALQLRFRNGGYVLHCNMMVVTAAAILVCLFLSLVLTAISLQRS